jgi:DNA-binding NarL/FixJ family response regulator
LIYRVLLVDDYAPWRRYIRSTFGSISGWQVVGEASDGPEAVGQTNALRPDLTLLDIGLPTLDGIHAARQILARDPAAKILFVSENPSSSVVEAALGTGARGYVMKSDAERELLPAMEAVMEGRRYVSATLKDRVVGPTLREGTSPEPRHAVGFYSDEILLLNDYARKAEATLEAGNVFVILASRPRSDRLEQTLRRRGVDVDRAIKERRYRFLDAADVLASFMVNGWPDRTRFLDAATSLIMEASRTSTGKPARLTLCGELAPTLLSAGNEAAAIRVEHLWDGLHKIHALDVLCGYLVSNQQRSDTHRVFTSICAEHSAIQSR